MLDEDNEKEESIYGLINGLCCSLMRTTTQQASSAPVIFQNEKFLAKIRGKCFEILLKKFGDDTQHSSEDDEDVNFNPLRAFDIHIFSLNLFANLEHIDCEQLVEEFNEARQAVAEEPYFLESPGSDIIKFLFKLQNDPIEEKIVPLSRKPELLVPTPFALRANVSNNGNSVVPQTDIKDILTPKPKFFKGVDVLKAGENPYIPKFFLNGETNFLSELDRKYNESNVAVARLEIECSFTGLTQRLLGTDNSSLRINTQALHVASNFKQTNNKNARNSAIVPIKKTIEVKENFIEPRRVLSWLWDQFDCFGINCSRPFASDSNVVHDLHFLIQHGKRQEFEVKVLSKEQFIRDVKHLTVGVQSDTFHHDNYLIFHMQNNVTVDDLLPETLRHFIEIFLECGTCFKRLQTMIMKKHYRLMFEGFIFKTICASIDEYLVTFRQYVYAYENENLIAFYDRMKSQIRQILNLSYTFGIHPNVNENIKPPMGSQFLGYIYHEIIRLTDNAYITLLMFILKRCCHVYFKYLQKWIFYGILDDPSNELFIGFVEQYRRDTKYFYDKAYFVRKESVPGFFQNYEDRILQCGKYTMLLKACKPNHPLFSLEYPTISASLSFEEIKTLELNCAKYAEKAREKCGKPVSMRELFEARAQKKQNFYGMVQESARRNLIDWHEEQKVKGEALAEIKRKQLADLNEQIKETKQRKMDERRANLELELQVLQESERLEDQRLLEENIKAKNRIEYYRELYEMTEGSKGKEKTDGSRNQGEDSGKVASSNSNQPSPVSTITISTADYESCCEEEEGGDEGLENDNDSPKTGSSVYIECKSEVSRDIEEFPETVEELRAACVDGSDSKKVEQQRPINNNSDNIHSIMGMKRSISDILNSNESGIGTSEQNSANLDGLSELQRNRLRVLGLSEVTQNEENPTTQLTDAQKNKLKVLTEEYNFRTDSITKSLPDINLNVIEEKDLTDLQRNRKRMMEDDLFSEYNRDVMAERAKLRLNLNTECARNRKKVLESEFNILSGEQNAVLTPMSTTSDPPISDGVSTDKDNKKTDLDEDGKRKKATMSGSGSTSALSVSNLRVDIDFASSPSFIGESVPQTGEPLETPLSALNTAGIFARNEGFEFAVPSKPQPNADLSMAAEESTMPQDTHKKVIENDVDETDDQTSRDEKEETEESERVFREPYARCMELIESNFNCPQNSRYFRWNNPRNSSSQVVKEKDRKNSGLKHFKMNSLSVITLTEFLRKSVIIPMDTYFELVNNEVMRLFLEDLDIMAHFRSLRNYFFLMNGEFGSLICDGIISRIESGETPTKVLNYQGLLTILDTALALSLGKDKNAERLSFAVANVPIKFELTNPNALNLLTLSYRIEWPLNLILTPDIMEKYAIIFRHLMKLGRINWILEHSCQLLKEAGKTHGRNLLRSPQYSHIQQMRHKFYHFINAFQHHITANALQSSWKVFKDDLLNAKCLEDIFRMHKNYVKRILFLCMLNERSSKFYEGIHNILKVTLRFYYNLKSHPFAMLSPDSEFTHPRYTHLQRDEKDFEKCLKFIIYLGNKIAQKGYQSEIREFINLINFNGYYTSSVVEEAKHSQSISTTVSSS